MDKTFLALLALEVVIAILLIAGLVVLFTHY